MKTYWIAVGLVVAAMGVGTSPAGAVEGSFFGDADYSGSGGRVEGKGLGVIAAGNREAAQAGMQILRAGGNAVDAAAATLFAVGVAQFESCGIGGGGFMVYRSADGQVVDTIDFREWSPKNYTFSDTASITGTGLAAWGTGHNVVGIPGAVAGMAMALQQHGSMPEKLYGERWRENWEKVLQPAIDLATNGFTVSKAAQESTKHPRIKFFPSTFEIYGGAPGFYETRQKMRNLPLAGDMRELQRLGPAAFYDPRLGDDTPLVLDDDGTIAADLLDEMNRPSAYNDQAQWDPTDLSEYQAISRPAVRTRYRGTNEYIGMGAPTAAGTAIAEVLNILEGYDLRAMGQSSADHVHLFAEAMKLAWRDRATYIGDPAFTPTPAFLTSKGYADDLRAQIDPAQAKAFAGPNPAEGANTHNIAVIDSDGNAVAVNCSIEQPMGSAVTAPGTGFALNNQLTDFEPTPWTAPPYDETNPRPHPNGWAPRKRPRSAMAPSIVAHKGVPVLVTGGIGGPTIIGGAAAAVLNVVDFRQDVAHAIDAERSDPRGLCPHPFFDIHLAGIVDDGLSLCLETTRFDNAVLSELQSRGHRLRSRHSCVGEAGDSLPDLDDDSENPLEPECEYSTDTLTHAVGINPVTGLRAAASDPRAFAWAAETASAGPRSDPNPGDMTALGAVFQEPPEQAP